MTELPIPPVNADSAPYWEGAREGRLMLQRCTKTGRAWFYPRHVSPATWKPTVEWFEASGLGSIYSFSVVHRAPQPAFAGRVPYVVALIDLDEGARMMTNVVGPDAMEAAIGDRVRVEFEERADGFRLPQFRRVAGQGGV